jgi:Glutamate-cysteine ligase
MIGRLRPYLTLLQKKASGELPTTAQWIRGFVRSHPEYKGKRHNKIINLPPFLSPSSLSISFLPFYLLPPFLSPSSLSISFLPFFLLSSFLPKYFLSSLPFSLSPFLLSLPFLLSP